MYVCDDILVCRKRVCMCDDISVCRKRVCVYV